MVLVIRKSKPSFYHCLLGVVPPFPANVCKWLLTNTVHDHRINIINLQYTYSLRSTLNNSTKLKMPYNMNEHMEGLFSHGKY